NDRVCQGFVDEEARHGAESGLPTQIGVGPAAATRPQAKGALQRRAKPSLVEQALQRPGARAGNGSSRAPRSPFGTRRFACDTLGNLDAAADGLLTDDQAAAGPSRREGMA